MEEYIRLYPPVSPAPSGFFIYKKDGRLQPCTDYRYSDDIMVKHTYLLPLVPLGLEQLLEVHIFTKLYLRSAYNLIQIPERDECKTAFITS